MDTHGNPAAGGTASGMSEKHLFSGEALDFASTDSENQHAPSPTIDWEAVRVAYEAGEISVREIGRRHGVSDTAIAKKAKAEGWHRGLRTPEAPAANPPPPPPQTKPQTAAQTDDDDDDGTYEFSCRDHRENLVVPTQMDLAAYWNTDGKVVIRQQADWDDYNDRMIFVSHQHVPALIRRLQAMLDGED
jgi:hypothetical protein